MFTLILIYLIGLFIAPVVIKTLDIIKEETTKKDDLYLISAFWFIVLPFIAAKYLLKKIYDKFNLDFLKK